MAYSFYIYYRIDPLQAAAAAQRINTLLRSIRQATGVSGRLMKKRGEPNLWMEVYESVPDSETFERELTVAMCTLNLNSVDFLQAETSRHTECFEDC